LFLFFPSFLHFCIYYNKERIMTGSNFYIEQSLLLYLKIISLQK